MKNNYFSKFISLFLSVLLVCSMPANTNIISYADNIAVVNDDDMNKDPDQIYGVRLNGDIKVVGNTLTKLCGFKSFSKRSKGRIPTFVTEFTNNEVNMKKGDFWYAIQEEDEEQKKDLFCSSSYDLSKSNIPKDATIKKAYLIWSATYCPRFRIADPTEEKGYQNVEDAGMVIPNIEQIKTVKFKTPNTKKYVDIKAERLDFLQNRPSAYQAYADVTDLVNVGGIGKYYVANVGSYIEGNDNYAAWAMVLVYEKKELPRKDVRVFYKPAEIDGSNSKTITLNKLYTPPVDPQVKVGIITFEGDYGYTGDQMLFQSGACFKGEPEIWSEKKPLESMMRKRILGVVDKETGEVKYSVIKGSNDPQLCDYSMEPCIVTDNMFVSDMYDSEDEHIKDGMGWTEERAIFTYKSSKGEEKTEYAFNPADHIMGIDIKLLKMNDLVPRANTFKYDLTSSGDVYYSGLVATSVELYVPDVKTTKVAKNRTALASGRAEWPAELGDIIEYTVTLKNTGKADAEKSIGIDTLPEEIEYVPNTLNQVIKDESGNSIKKHLTDQDGDDLGRYDPVKRTLVINLGKKATKESGGTLEAKGKDDIVLTYLTSVVARSPEIINKFDVVYQYFDGDGPTKDNDGSDNNIVTKDGKGKLDVTKTTIEDDFSKDKKDIHYVIKITNTGDVVIRNLKVEDEKIKDKLPDIGNIRLQPNKSIVIGAPADKVDTDKIKYLYPNSLVYTVTDEEINAKEVANTAKVEGDTVFGHHVVSNDAKNLLRLKIEPEVIVKHVGDKISKSEILSKVTIPDGVDKNINVNIPDTTEVGNSSVRVEVVYSDGTRKDVDVPIHVVDNGSITKKKGDSLTKEEIKKEVKLPEGVKTIGEPSTVDTSKVGDYTSTVEVEFNDGSKTTIEVPVHVVNNGEIIKEQNDPISDDEIKAKVEKPDNASVEVIKKPSTNNVGETKARVKITFNNGDTTEIDVPVKVIEKTPETIPNIIIKHKGSLVTDEEIKENLNAPKDAKNIEILTRPNKDEVGNYTSKVRITYANGNTKEVDVPIHVVDNGSITKKKGDSLTKEEIKKEVKLPEGVKTIGEPSTVDTSKVGDYTSTVEVEFNDGSKTTIEVPVHVVESKEVIKHKNDPISNKDITDNVVVPQGAKTEVIGKLPNTDTVGKTEVDVEVTFENGDKTIVKVPVTIKDKKPWVDIKPIFKPQAFVKHKGEVISEEDILKNANIPEGATGVIKGSIPKTTDVTNHNVTVEVTFADGSKKEVEVPIHVVDNGSITKKKGDSLTKEEIKKEVKLPEGVKTIGEPSTVDTSKVGDYTSTVEVEFNDGSKTTIEVPVHVVESKEVIKHKNDPISNKDITDNVVVPQGAKTEVIGKLPNTDTVGKTEVDVEITFENGDKTIVKVPVTIKDKKPWVDIVDIPETIPNIIIKHKGSLVTDEEIKENLNAPKDAKNIEILTRPNKDEVGNYTSKVRITYANGSKKEVEVPIHVVDNGSITKKKGDSLTKEEIKKEVKLPEGVKTIGEPSTVDTSKVGDYTSTVEVEFNDGSKTTIEVPVHVVESKEVIKHKKDPISNKDITDNVVVPQGAKIKVIGKLPNTDTVGKTEVDVEVTFENGDKSIVKVPVTIKDKMPWIDMVNIPVATPEVITVRKGEVIDYTKGIQNYNNYPEGTTIRVEKPADNTRLSTPEEPQIAKVKIIFENGVSTIVEVPVIVLDKKPWLDLEEIPVVNPDKIEIYKGDYIDYKKGIKDLPDGSSIEVVEGADNMKLSTPEQPQIAKVKIKFKDGASTVVEVPVIVKNKVPAIVMTPVPKMIPKIIYTNVGSKIDYNDGIFNPQEGATIEVLKPADTSIDGESTAKIKVVFKNGSSTIMYIPVIISDGAYSTATSSDAVIPSSGHGGGGSVGGPTRTETGNKVVGPAAKIEAQPIEPFPEYIPEQTENDVEVIRKHIGNVPKTGDETPILPIVVIWSFMLYISVSLFRRIRK